MRERRRISLRRLPIAVVAKIGALLLVVVAVYLLIPRVTSTPAAAPPAADQLITVAPGRSREVDYGPARITIESGATVVLPGSGVSKGREIILQEGRISARVDALERGRNFFVRTPNAVAGVRGTAFSVEFVRGLETLVDVAEGSVFIAVANDTWVVLEEGHAARVTGMTAPELVGEIRLDVAPPIDFPTPSSLRLEAPPPVFHDATSRSAPSVAPPPLPTVRSISASPDRGSTSLVDPSLDPLAVQSVQIQPSNPQPQNPQPQQY